MRLSSIPVSAWVGILGIALSLFCAVFAPLIAPYGESQIVGSVWEPMGGAYLSAPTISVATSSRG